MGYESLEEQGLISPSLCEAIDNELEISDLLFFGSDCNDEDIRNCYEKARAISGELTDSEKIILGAVGKRLWQLRVNSVDNPAIHKEYSPDMETEIKQQDDKMNKLPDVNLRSIAGQILQSLDLPHPISMHRSA